MHRRFEPRLRGAGRGADFLTPRSGARIGGQTVPTNAPCLQEFTGSGAVLGQGVAGVVKESCRAASASDCGFVRKQSVLATGEEKMAFERDARYMGELQSSGLVPKLFCASLESPTSGILVMQRFDTDFASLGEKQLAAEVAKNGSVLAKLLNLPDIAPVVAAVRGAGIAIRLYTEAQLRAALKVVGDLYSKNKIVHSDISARNLLYKASGAQVVVTDFGMAGDAQQAPVATTNALRCWESTGSIPTKYWPYYNMWQLQASLCVNSITFVQTSAGTGFLRGLAAKTGVASQSEYQLLDFFDDKLIPASINEGITSYCPGYKDRLATTRPLRDKLAKQLFLFILKP